MKAVETAMSIFQPGAHRAEATVLMGHVEDSCACDSFREC